MPLSNRDRTRVDLGRTNRRAVLAEIVLRGPVSRTEIARNTELTAATVSRITRDLIAADVIAELPDTASAGDRRGPGRRFVGLDINPGGGFVLGFGVNVFRQSVTLADLKNRRIARRDLALGTLSDPDSVLRQLTDAAATMVDAHVADRRRLFGGVFAITGAVDPVAGVVRASPYLGWREVSVGPRIGNALGIPIRVDSNPHAIALAESRFGIARAHESILLVNCSLGLGASFLTGQRVIRGSAFTAGAIGGMRPPQGASGAQTLDMAAGGQGVLKRLAENAAAVMDLPANELARQLLHAVGRARGKDPVVCRAMADSGRVLGRTIAQYVGLLQPDAVVIAGPLSECEDYVEACREEMLRASGAARFDVLVSPMSVPAAARWLAINEYLIERDLDLDGLKLTRAA